MGYVKKHVPTLLGIYYTVVWSLILDCDICSKKNVVHTCRTQRNDHAVEQGVACKSEDGAETDTAEMTFQNSYGKQITTLATNEKSANGAILHHCCYVCM